MPLSYHGDLVGELLEVCLGVPEELGDDLPQERYVCACGGVHERERLDPDLHTDLDRSVSRTTTTACVWVYLEALVLLVGDAAAALLGAEQLLVRLEIVRLERLRGGGGWKGEEGVTRVWGMEGKAEMFGGRAALLPAPILTLGPHPTLSSIHLPH